MRFILICLIAFFGNSSSMAEQASSEPSTELAAIIDTHWTWFLNERPQLRSQLGDQSASDQWNNDSLEAQARRYAKRGALLDQLAAIEVEALNDEDTLNHTLLTRRLEHKRTRYELGLHYMKLTMREGPQQLYTAMEYAEFDTEQDYRRWITRLKAIPSVLGSHRELLAEGIARERVQPRVVMERIPGQLDAVITTASQSPFYKPFVSMPNHLSTAVAKALRTEAIQVIDTVVTPAYREFRDFFVSTYLSSARPEAGVGSLPGGKEIYQFLARDFTTTTLTPAEIHEMGKREVTRILKEMEVVKQSVNFEGDLHSFNNFLRNSPQFYYDNPEDLLQGYRAIAKRIDPELVKLFGVLPRTPYGVKTIPMETAPDTTTAYYMEPAANGTRAGYFYVNLYKPEVRPKYEMEVLSIHEAVPGHHLQIALALEQDNIPMFRKLANITAFVEGWALYAEQLGYPLGLYQDPYSQYGQLTYDMWRAVRLVVDTGMHYFSWSRQQAIDYFMANAGKTQTDIINEIDRYIGWPGQALAYKVGQLKISALRDRAQETLGDAFDIRQFHDELLAAGAIPLDTLDRRMGRWLESKVVPGD